MSKRLDELFANLQTCDLKMAAFTLGKSFSDGLYPKELAQALELFTKVPCPETAVIFVQACPEAADVMALSNGGLAQSLPIDCRGPRYHDLDQWMQTYEQNLRANDVIHAFLLDGARDGTVSIGFHRMRNQRILFDRMATIGIRKRLFRKGRKFLRDRITGNRSAFRAVSDLVCIHGIHNGHEYFWGAMGGELDAQWYLHSEILYDLSISAGLFAELLRDLRSPTRR